MKNATAKSYFVVEQGWVKETHLLGEMYSDDPFVWEYETADEAEQGFAEIEKSLAHDYRVERQCAGRGWSEKDLYVQLKYLTEVLDEDGDLEDIAEDVLKESRYTCDDYSRDRG